MGGGGDEPDTDIIELLSPDQRALRDRFVRTLGPQVGQPFDITPFVPGASPLQQAGFNEAARLIGQEPPELVDQAINRLVSGEPAFTADPAQREAFFRTAFEAPALRTFEQDVLPAIAETFAGRNLQRGGSFQRALARAGSDFGANLSAQRAALLRSDIEDERRAQLAAQGLTPIGLQLAQQRALLPINVGLEAGAQQRNIAGQLGQAELASSTPFFNPALGFLPLALSPTQTIAQSPGTPSPFGGVLGGALGGAALGTSLGFGPVGIGLGALGGGLLGGLA